jgi:hypothetical protein
MKLVSELQKNLLLNNKNFFKLKRAKHVIVLCSLFFSLGYRSQIANYVSNGGFESLLSSSVTSGFDAVKYWGPIDTTQNASFFFSLSDNSAPYCSTGFQYPRSGNNFIGTTFFCNNCPATNSRFYPRNRLKQLLQAGKTYCAKYYVVNTNNNRVAIDKYGMYFGDSSIDTITQCMGNEKYMVIGNFRSNAATNTLQLNTPLTTQSADIYIDDVSVIELNLPAYAGADIWGIPTTTVYLGRPKDVGIDEACIWYKLPNNTNAIDTAPGITVTVGLTINTYVVRQEICGNVKWDTVIVYPSATGLSELEYFKNNISLFPNPATDNLNITLNFYLEKEFTKIEILNSLGQLIREEEIVFKNKTATIKTGDLPNGVYLLNLRGDNSYSVGKRFTVAR